GRIDAPCGLPAAIARHRVALEAVGASFGVGRSVRTVLRLGRGTADGLPTAFQRGRCPARRLLGRNRDELVLNAVAIRRVAAARLRTRALGVGPVAVVTRLDDVRPRAAETGML